jgi:NRPS condensation-like uncharacterized protein
MSERFAVPDELTCYYDRAGEPANVHLEVQVPGKLDERILRASVQAVLAAEPAVRARRERSSGWRHGYRWEVPPVPDVDPVAVVTHSDQPGLDAQRDAFLSEARMLDVSPPLGLLLSSGPDGDCLILSAHHARLDGLSCVRLLRRVASEYGARAARLGEAGLPADPAARPGAELLVPENASEPAAVQATAVQARATRFRWSGARKVVRIAHGNGRRARRLPGYGAHLMSWDGLHAADWLRSYGASVNDLLISALVVTVCDWNEARDPHAAPAGTVRITMPVGDRTQGGEAGQWANKSRLTVVTARAACAVQPLDLLGDVTRQTRSAKVEHGPQVDLASRMLVGAPLPVRAKQMLLRAALRIAGSLICDTSLVSNLGQIEAPAFGSLTASQVWFSTSAHMPRGLSLGAVTAGGRLRLTFRYRRALFSPADAAEFAARFAKALDQFAARVPAPRVRRDGEENADSLPGWALPEAGTR